MILSMMSSGHHGDIVRTFWGYLVKGRLDFYQKNIQIGDHRHPYVACHYFFTNITNMIFFALVIDASPDFASIIQHLSTGIEINFD